MRAGPTAGSAVAGLILAAGESSRMGRDKALLDYRGRTFLETIIAKLREAGLSRMMVVLGHHAEDIRRVVNLSGVEVVTNHDYLRGQTSSLQVGLMALDNRPARSEPPRDEHSWDSSNFRARFLAPLGMTQFPKVVQETAQDERKLPDAVLLCLVDHPAFEPATVSTLVTAFTSAAVPMIIPTFGGRRGHPVLIARPLFEPLLALAEDQGANSVIQAWRPQTQLVEVADPGILMDVDDPSAYLALGET